MIRQKNRGLTLVETLVYLALGSVVFGLVLGALISTERASARLSATEQMRQEAMLVAQSVDRVLRYRVAPADLDLRLTAGGAAEPESPTGGGADDSSTTASGADTNGSIPGSILQALATSTSATSETAGTTHPMIAATQSSPTAANAASTATSSATPAPSPTPAATPDPKTMPPSVRAVFETTGSASQVPAPQTTTTQQQAGTAQPAAPAAPSQATAAERFSTDELIIYSLNSGPDPSRLVTAIRNSPGLGQEPMRAYLEQSAAGGAFGPGSHRETLGPNPDKFQTQVFFRYATDFDGVNAQWARESRLVPRVVEYTVRVWPRTKEPTTFEESRDPDGRPSGIQITSAVALP